MWLGGFESHLSVEALWMLMHINEMGSVTPDISHTPSTLTHAHNKGLLLF